MSETKRRFLKRVALAGFAGSVGLSTLALAREHVPTTLPMDLGPFYPAEKPMEEDTDLTRLAGHSMRAKGQVIEVAGRVLGSDGKPVAGAKLEIWQANAAGRYSHYGDHHPLPLDENFQGYANLSADGEGRYRFLTVKPGAYPASDTLRSPHIHFDVTGRYDRIVTQMYFPGEPTLANDLVLRHDLDGEDASGGFPPNIFGVPAVGKSSLESGATLYVFDLVLRNG
jgi:protocatechuate 3,4-dioxygenase beta subunit